MPDYIVLKRIRLDERHKPTGKTHHYYGPKELPSPRMLEIAKYPDDPGFYLFYLDENGEWLTDTYHDSLQLAMEQAKWEFNVQPGDWESSPTQT